MRKKEERENQLFIATRQLKKDFSRKVVKREKLFMATRLGLRLRSREDPV